MVSKIESATMEKVRRRTIEERTREFRDACEFLVDHPLLLWAPQIGKAARSLEKAVEKLRRRTMAPRIKSEKRGTS
jgi:hypothetical protein